MSEELKYVDMSISEVKKYISELTEEIKELRNTCDEIQRRNIAGVLFPDEILSLIDIVYPKDHDSHLREVFVSEMIIPAVTDIHTFLEIRKAFAISGAMRWEFSQEVPVHGGPERTQFTIGYTPK